jgi:O-antigen ligase
VCINPIAGRGVKVAVPLLSLSSALGTLLAFYPNAYLVVGVLTGIVFVLVLLIFVVKWVGKTKAVAAIGVLLLSGFLGTYTDITVINDWVRWIAPLSLLAIAIYNKVSIPGLVGTADRNLRSFLMLLGLFSTFALFSSSYSAFPSVTLGRSITFLAITGGTQFALLPHLRSARDIEILLWAIAVLMGLAILPGEFLVLTPGGIGWLGGRFRSSFWNPVTLGHMSVVFLPLLVWIVSDIRLKIRYRALALGMCACLFLNIALAQSRSALLGVMAVVAVFCLELPAKAKVVLGFGAVAGATVVLGLELEPGHLMDFLTRGRDFGDPALASGRVPAWIAAYQSWQSAPLWGYGFGTGGDPEISQSLLGASGAIRVSNVYLETLATGGLVGFILLVAVIVTAFLQLVSTLQHPQPAVYRLGLMALATFLGGLVLNLFETWLVSAGSPFAFYWWLVVFLAIRQTGFGIANSNPASDIHGATSIAQRLR